MRLLVVNPNSTASMTAGIAAAARAVAAADTEIVAATAAIGPVSIEGYYDEALCLPGLIEQVLAHRGQGMAQGIDGVVVACFDDTGVDAIRTLCAGPVIGLCQAALQAAAVLGHRVGVVTTLSRSVPAIEGLVQRYGMAGRCRVRAAEVPVLALEDPASSATDRIRAEIAEALAHDGADCIVLGCAGMAALTRRLSAEFGVPVIDGVAAAVKLVEGLAAIGLGTSKAGAYALPAAKPYLGSLAAFAPG